LKKGVNPYQIFNDYCLRVPLFSFSSYKKKIEKKEFFNKDFKELLTDSIFREAIFLASPELFSQIEKWEETYLTDTQKVEKLQIAILKYFTRISTRCTPFGLFASCSLGSFDSKTIIRLNDANSYRRITRFDATFLVQLFSELLKNKSLRENLLFYPNTSLYTIGNRYRYIEYIINSSFAASKAL
jgi:hypothetical protein